MTAKSARNAKFAIRLIWMYNIPILAANSSVHKSDCSLASLSMKGCTLIAVQDMENTHMHTGLLAHRTTMHFFNDQQLELPASKTYQQVEAGIKLK